MFNFDFINGYKVLRSDILRVDEGVNVFFTTRGFRKGKLLRLKMVKVKSQFYLHLRILKNH